MLDAAVSESSSSGRFLADTTAGPTSVPQPHGGVREPEGPDHLELEVSTWEGPALPDLEVVAPSEVSAPFGPARWPPAKLPVSLGYIHTCCTAASFPHGQSETSKVNLVPTLNYSPELCVVS